MIGLSGSTTGSSAVVSSSGFSGFLDADVWESVLVAVLLGALRPVFESESTACSSAGFLDAVCLEADADFLETVFQGGDLRRFFGDVFGGVQRHMQQDSYPITFCQCNSCLVDCMAWNASCFSAGRSAGGSASWKKG